MDKIKNQERAVKEHYQRPDLSTIITSAFERAGREIVSYTDTEALDEFHIRGRPATRELAQLAGMRRGFRVLDLGCGLGGATRLLAAEFGCMVTGIDIMPEFIQTAEMLTGRVGLNDRIVYRIGNMLDMSFDKCSFEAVWSQHTFMNIADKNRLFREVQRMLQPEGILAFYEIVQGQHTPVHYPVQWANTAAINFLLKEAHLIEGLGKAGFEKVTWQDATSDCLQWFQTVVDRLADRPQNGPPALGLNLVIGPTTAQKAINTTRNLKEDRIRVVYGVFRKTAG